MRDYFAILGLTPGVYRPAEIEQRFRAERDRCLATLHQPAQHTQSRSRLDELHTAYQTLVDPKSQQAYLATVDKESDAVTQMRHLIAAALEDGLLRYSRRKEIIERGRQLGFSEFQIHLMIAQVQFGDAAIDAPAPRKRRWRFGTAPVVARLVGIVLLAAGLFILMLQLLGLR